MSEAGLPPAAKAFRVAHAAFAVAQLTALGYVWFSALTGRRDRKLAGAVGFLALEGAALVVGRGNCPMGPFQTRLGDPVPLFELVLPPRAAKAAVPVLAGITFAGLGACSSCRAPKGTGRSARDHHGGRGVVGQAVDAYRVNSSAIAVALLVVTNLIPLVGVLWLGWDLLLILALYWAENGVVGVINILKILTAEGTSSSPSTMRWSVNGRPASSLSRLGTAGFFTIHYGLFWVVHGVFVFTFIPAMTGLGAPGGTPSGQLSDPLLDLPGVDLPVFAFGVVGLAISHGVSFWMNYLGRGEYKTLSPADVMTQPYGRLVIMHMTILLGAFVSIFLGTPLGSLLVLVVLKTALDLAFHLRQHRDVAAGAVPIRADGPGIDLDPGV